MQNKPFDDSNWREEYKAYTSDKKQLELLENGPKSLSQSWMMAVNGKKLGGCMETLQYLKEQKLF